MLLRAVIVSILGLTFLQQGCSPEPGKRKVKAINILVGAGAWRLTIQPDGSGAVGFGSNPDDAASFPKGAVDFAVALDVLRGTSTDKQKHVVIVAYEGSSSMTTRYTSDDEGVQRLFEQAVPAVQSDRMHQLWKTQNPFPGKRTRAATEAEAADLKPSELPPGLVERLRPATTRATLPAAGGTTSVLLSKRLADGRVLEVTLSQREVPSATMPATRPGAQMEELEHGEARATLWSSRRDQPLILWERRATWSRKAPEDWRLRVLDAAIVRTHLVLVTKEACHSGVVVVNTREGRTVGLARLFDDTEAKGWVAQAAAVIAKDSVEETEIRLTGVGKPLEGGKTIRLGDVIEQVPPPEDP